MRVVFCVCLIVFLAAFLDAQEKDKWKRVYTFDDAKVEMNVSNVKLGLGEDARVRFRWTLAEPANVREKPGTKYKSRIESIEFICPERRYRLVEVSLLDAKGNLILNDDAVGEWKYLKAGSMMARLFGPACSLIDEKKRKP